MVFLAAENENRQLEDLPQLNFGCVPWKISPVGKEKVDNWEFEHWKLRPLLFS